VERIRKGPFRSMRKVQAQPGRVSEGGMGHQTSPYSWQPKRGPVKQGKRPGRTSARRERKKVCRGLLRRGNLVRSQKYREGQRYCSFTHKEWKPGFSEFSRIEGKEGGACRPGRRGTTYRGPTNTSRLRSGERDRKTPTTT